MDLKQCITILAFVFINLHVQAQEKSTRDFEELNETNSTKVLSRRKRFLVFPDGSSFQLVFCTQTHGYLQVGDVVWFGSTAALAWELPSDPKTFYFLKELKKNELGAQRRGDVGKHITYVDEKGKVLAKVPYRRKPIINPAFAKRSVDYLETKHNRDIEDIDNSILDRISIETMHKTHHESNHLLCTDLKECNADFHRDGRRKLYEKLETFFDVLGLRGRQCMLRMLCESSRPAAKQDTFLGEIMRSVFTLPGGHEFETDYHRAYDQAHAATGNCNKLFPECELNLS